MKKILFSIGMLVLTTAAFSQECFQILSGTRIQKELDGSQTLVINYNTTGLKALSVIVKCGSNIILDSCFLNNGNGTKTYSNLTCTTSTLTAILTPHVGSCSSTTCSDTTITGPAPALLPVRISSFSAVRSKQVVSLSWNTEFELDAKEFIVERAEGTEFRSVGTIKSNGNSTVRKSYSFNDKNDNSGTTYYRLKSVDLNGSFNYSEIRTVKGYGAVNNVTVFPNPAHSNSNVSLVGVTVNSSIQLLDFSGKILKTVNSTSTNSFDLTGVKNGTYLIRIVDKTTNEIVNKTLTVNN